MMTTLMPAAARARSSRSWLNAMLLPGLVCLAIQLVSATWLVSSFRTPNASTLIAENIVASHAYKGGSSRLFGLVPDRSSELRAFQPPGEPLYLAAMFWLLPKVLWRYIHVPVTVMMVCAVAYCAYFVNGIVLAWIAGLWAACQPFVVLHGPVWDDTFFSAALVWSILALLMRRSTYPSQERSRLELAVLFLLSMAACISRTEGVIVLALLALATWAFTALRPLRFEAALITAALLISLGLWGLRNYSVLGHFVIGTTRDGIALWESNGPYTRASLTHGQVEAYSYRPSIMAVHWARTGTMSEFEADRYYQQQAVTFILTHPGETFKTATYKLYLSLLGLRPEERLVTPRNMVSIVSNILLFALSAIGTVLLKKQLGLSSATSIMFMIIAVSNVLMLAIGPIGLRYRISLDGVMWILSAATIRHLAIRLRLKTKV